MRGWTPNNFQLVLQHQSPGLIVASRVGVFEEFGDWTLTPGRNITYQTTVAQYTSAHSFRVIDQVRVTDPAATVPEPVYVAPSDAPVVNQVQSVSLTLRASIALVDANPSSFFFDAATSILYVSMADSSSTLRKSIKGGFSLYVGSGNPTPGECFEDADGNVYWPYLCDVPSLRKSVGSPYYGVIQQGGGTLAFCSGTGALDESFARYEWVGEVSVYLGAAGLPWSEFFEFKLGRGETWTLTENLLTVQVVDAANDLEARFPKTLFAAADVTEPRTFYRGGDQTLVAITVTPDEVEPTAATTRLLDSQPKPVAYGLVRGVTPPPVALSAAEGVWQLTHHPNYAIESVNVDGELVGAGGVGTTFIWYATGDLAVLYVAAVGGLVDLTTATVAVTFTGKKAESGEPLENFADIVADLVTVEGQLTTPFNAAVLARSRFAASMYASSIYIASENTLSAVLDNIMRSTLGYLYLSNAGEYCYHVWTPSVADEFELDEAWGDYLDAPEQVRGAGRTYQTVTVEYGYNPTRNSTVSTQAALSTGNRVSTSAGDYLRVVVARPESAALVVGRKRTFPVSATYIADEPSAFVLGTRYARLCQNAEHKLRARSKLRPMTLDVMSRLTPVKQRLGVVSGRSLHLEVLGTERNLQDGTITLETDDQKVVGTQAFIAEDGDLEWGAATADERQTNGFHTDDQGFVTDAASSYGTSRYW